LTKINRRNFVQMTAGTVGLAALPNHVARAMASESELKFIFVQCFGGWDVTRVFANVLDNGNVATEEQGQAVELGDLVYISHPNRPAVDSFFQSWGESCLIVNGILVPSVSHDACVHLMLTGGVAESAPDWCVLLSAPVVDTMALPHLVIEGSSFAGTMSGISTRVGTSGNMDGLLTGHIIDKVDEPTSVHGPDVESVLDAYQAQRASDWTDSQTGDQAIALGEAFSTATGRAYEMKDMQDVVNWSGGQDFNDQTRLAVELLANGVSRCVTVRYSGAGWDTHQDNDDTQSNNFEGLFSALQDLLASLTNESGEAGGTLADETVVVVISEMGRTPNLNEEDGKDHWPFTSALVVGPGVDGGRTAGGFDDHFYGHLIDPETGEASEDGIDLSAGSFGATLLALAGIDYEEYLPGYQAITGLLS